MDDKKPGNGKAGRLRFFKTPNSIPGADSIVFGILDFDCSRRGICTRSLAGLAEITGETVHRTQARLKRLIQAGHVHKARRYNKSNVYTTEATTGTYAPVPAAEMDGRALEEVWLYARLRFAQNGNGCTWPALKTLCEWSSWSENTVTKYLSILEDRRDIQVKRKGGGHHRGNTYVCQKLRSRSETRPQKLPTGNDKSKELKTPAGAFDQKVLSSRKDEEAVQSVLVAKPVSMRPAAAEQLIFEHKVPLPALRNLIKNAMARQFWLKQHDPFAAGRFNLAGYILNACENMRNEGKSEVKLSTRSRALSPPPPRPAGWLDEQKRLLKVS